MQTVETLNEGLKRSYTLTIAAQDIATRVESEIASIAPQMNMPGFRKGKVPANLVRKMHGDSIHADAINKLIQDSVQALIAEQALRPAMSPSVALNEGYAQGADAEVLVALEVLPVVDAPKVEGLKLERLAIALDEAAVDAAVQLFAANQRNFDDAPAGHKAATGDMLVMDYHGKTGGESFDGGKGEGMSIELGSGNLIPGFEEGLIGIALGEERTVSVTFPEDYNAAYLAGKAARFDVKVTAVKCARDVIADDAFAQSLGLTDLAHLRSLLKAQLEQEYNGLTRTHMKRKLLDELAARHSFACPPSMVEAEFAQIWQQLEEEAQGEPDPAAARVEMENDRAEYVRIAERRVRLGLLLSEIGQANGIDITQQEMNRLIAMAAQNYNAKDRDRFVEYIRNDAMAAAQLRAPLYEDKVVDYLFSIAEITDRAATKEELEAAIEEEEGHVHGPGCGHDHDDAATAKPARKPAAKKVKAVDATPDAPALEPVAPAKKPAARKAAKPKAE